VSGAIDGNIGPVFANSSARLRIGITLGLTHEAETLWSNGIKQNAVFLAESLRQCDNVANVRLVNMSHVEVTPALPWNLERWPTVAFDDAKDDLDVLIELGGQVGAAETDYLKGKGTRLVSYCCGTEYVTTMESVLFGKPSFGLNLFVNQRYDAVWMVPQVASISEPYFSVLRRRPARAVPFVWDPVFLRERAADFANSGEYRPRGDRAARLTVMEPNINVVKFCLYPIFIAEEAFRKRPDSIAFLHVTNADHLAKDSKEFVAVMNQLDIVRQGKATFVGRFDTPQFLAEHTDVVISHQWENPLNYFYLEACWQGFPLVHNARLCQELGYYYAGNDVNAGCAQLLKALAMHDGQWEAYRDRQRAFIDRFLPSNPQVRSEYARLLNELVAQPIV
jgi:hypothetical protein